MKTAHLFAGGGGGLYADLILGHEPVFAAEIDPYACNVLERRRDEGWWPSLSVWQGDVRVLNPSEIPREVGCLSAGFPCQDISMAGEGRGLAGDKSGLVSEVWRIARAIRPRYIFLENSPAITSRGLGEVLGELASMGYNARWCVIPASAVGAPHQRARWWCLAHDANIDSIWELQQEGLDKDLGRWVNYLSEKESRFTSHPDKEGWTNTEGKSATEEKAIVRRASNLGSVPSSRSSSPSWWETEPFVGGVVHGVAHAQHRIELLGNGQVPLQAALAWMLLGGPR